MWSMCSWFARSSEAAAIRPESPRMPPLRVLFGRSTARWPRRRYPNSGPLRSGDETHKHNTRNQRQPEKQKEEAAGAGRVVD